MVVLIGLLVVLGIWAASGPSEEAQLVILICAAFVIVAGIASWRSS